MRVSRFLRILLVSVTDTDVTLFGVCMAREVRVLHPVFQDMFSIVLLPRGVRDRGMNKTGTSRNLPSSEGWKEKAAHKVLINHVRLKHKIEISRVWL